jgi:hypothetical protein
MGDDIGYINLGKIKAASLPEIFKEFENTSGLVIDIRNYPSEFMPFALGKYLKPHLLLLFVLLMRIFNYPEGLR